MGNWQKLQITLISTLTSLEMRVRGFWPALRTSENEASEENGDEEPISPVVNSPEHPHLVEIAQEKVCIRRL